MIWLCWTFVKIIRESSQYYYADDIKAQEIWVYLRHELCKMIAESKEGNDAIY